MLPRWNDKWQIGGGTVIGIAHRSTLRRDRHRSRGRREPGSGSAAPTAEGRVVKGFEGLDVGDRCQVKLGRTDVARGFIDFERLQ